MTIPSTSQVKLYPHDSKTLIPLLEGQTPRSLPVLATILENSSRSASRSNEGGEVSEYDVGWTTFPPSDLRAIQNTTNGSGDRAGSGIGQGPRLWGVVVRMQEEDSVHLRFYCSAESEFESETGTKVEDEEEVQTFIQEVTKSIVSIWGKRVTLGAISNRWNKAMRGEVDARELVECSVFLAPETRNGSRIDGNPDDDDSADQDVKRLEEMGLKLDIAREEDVAMIKSTCDVPRPFVYYASRCPQSTVIRLLDPPYTAVCWIILHSDGALGALYTIPAYRRKGLAAIVVRRNIISRSQGAGKTRDFCYVFKGNLASEGLWRKMGWVEGWGVRWIVNRDVEEARGKVARFSHADE